MVEVNCNCCRQPFKARVADRKRGWGKYYSKRCKAVKQEARTGQYATHMHGSDFAGYDDFGEPLFYAGNFDNTQNQ